MALAELAAFHASDTVGLFACWETDPPITNGIYVDLEVYYRILGRLREIADFVLPGHDMAVLERARYPRLAPGVFRRQAVGFDRSAAPGFTPTSRSRLQARLGRLRPP